MSKLNFIYFGSVFLQVVLNLQEIRPPTYLSVFEGRGYETIGSSLQHYLNAWVRFLLGYVQQGHQLYSL